MADEKPKSPKKLQSVKPDVASLIGIVVAIGGILAGLVLDGGKVTQLLQKNAALIVLGGTLGAVLLTSPLAAVLRAAKGLKSVFLEEVVAPEAAIEEIIAYATKARKSSIISLEEDLPKINHPFLRKALTLAVDGTDLKELKDMMELDMEQGEKREESAVKVFEAAGGYAPTIGIIGAVLGLMQVMQHLENIDEVGRGIAAAFVATVYGVAFANLLFLPSANKLKARMHSDVTTKELMLEGVASILEGMNPKLIRVKLEAFLPHAPKASKKAGKESGAEEPAAARS
ncbi:MAG TPA: flagellar motor protein [Bryobacteraceae bacterium]|jgi:chemotaxis protein MotA